MIRSTTKMDPLARFTDPETNWIMYREICGWDDKDGMPVIAGHDGCPTLVRADKYGNYDGLVMFAEDGLGIESPPARYLELDGCLIERFSAKAVAEWHDQLVVSRTKHGTPDWLRHPDEILKMVKTQITEL